MGFNVDMVEYLTDSKLSITGEKVKELLEQYKEDYAPESIIDNLLVMTERENILDGCWLYAEGSGSFYADYIEHFLSQTTGCADLMFCWEGGESYTGLRVKNGQVIEMDVKHILVESEDE